MENWPDYESYIRGHLGGQGSRVALFAKYLCPEIEYHCGRLKNARVLDFGCGTGSSSVALAQYAKEVCSFDIDQESIDICKQRVHEHGFDDKVTFYCAKGIETLEDTIGSFDVILAEGVFEHIPLSRIGLRKKVILTLFDILKRSGYLVIDDTPNRLWPFDFHTTHLWWIPWTKPGSSWAYRRAIKKGKHSDALRLSKGPLGLEERGAWGVTWWDIKDYLSERDWLCVNTMPGHNRHVRYMKPQTEISSEFQVLESVMYITVVKLLRLPIVAFSPSLRTLVIKKS